MIRLIALVLIVLGATATPFAICQNKTPPEKTGDAKTDDKKEVEDKSPVAKTGRPPKFGNNAPPKPPNPEDVAACAACGGTGCTTCVGGTATLIIGGIALVVSAVVLNLALLIWVARDAKNRSMDSSVIWMLLVMATGPLGLILYVFSRPQGPLVRCEDCGNSRMKASKKCPHCDNS